MKRKTVEQLAELPNSRLIRRHDKIRAVYQFTKWENVARRALCRLSVISDAAKLQETKIIRTLNGLKLI